MTDQTLNVWLGAIIFGLVLGQLSYWFFYSKCPEDQKQAFSDSKNDLYIFTIFPRSTMGLMLLMIVLLQLIPNVNNFIVKFPDRVNRFIKKVEVWFLK